MLSNNQKVLLWSKTTLVDQINSAPVPLKCSMKFIEAFSLCYFDRFIFNRSLYFQIWPTTYLKIFRGIKIRPSSRRKLVTASLTAAFNSFSLTICNMP